eukprot:CCRYP_015971-RA/>CCRYP_015971-RA protein AED:0.42 eAED:0.42 QI:0/-1/0/1/-1/1/1/0/121
MFSSSLNTHANVIGSTNVTNNNVIRGTNAGFLDAHRGNLHHHSNRSHGLSRSRPRHTTADTRANTSGSISPPHRRAHAPPSTPPRHRSVSPKPIFAALPPSCNWPKNKSRQISSMVECTPD